VKDDLQKKLAGLIREKANYGIALAVMAAVLLAIGFPGYVLVFLGVTTFFVWKAFASTEKHHIRGVFEFYLAANEILRDDEKRWFGFEVQEVLHSGEKILNVMPDPPPLMLFTLGALHHKIGNYETAAQYLGSVLENEQMDENRRLIASPELKNYVRILRRIEREPAEAPQTSAAVRALERARKNRAVILLEESRKKIQALKDARAIELAERAQEGPPILDLTTSVVDAGHTYHGAWNGGAADRQNGASSAMANGSVNRVFEEDKIQTDHTSASNGEEHGTRKPISEVLKDIYGR
jgi:tetratricopeptide (TPR) repeat protein